MSDSINVSALRALLEKATPGPWTEADDERLSLNYSANAAVCIAAVNDLPALLDEIERLRAQAIKAEDERDALREAAQFVADNLSSRAEVSATYTADLIALGDVLREALRAPREETT